MSNPIKTSDIYQDSGELRRLLDELKAVRSELQHLQSIEIKRAKKVESATRKLNETTIEGREAIADNARVTADIQKKLAKYSDALDENAVKVAAIKNATLEQNRINKLKAKILVEEVGSYNRLSAQYSLNKTLLNQMTVAERESTKEGRELEKQTFDLYQEMKRLQERTGKHSLSVGDYTKATREAGKEQKRLVAELKELQEAFDDAKKSGKATADNLEHYENGIADLTEQIDNLGSVTGKTTEDFKEGFIDKMAATEGAAGQAAQGIKGVGKSIKALMKNPLVLFLAAIAGALIALFNAFKRSERGAQLLAKATGLMKGVMSALTGLADSIAEKLEFAFTNPKEAIANLGRSIVEGLLNRFKAIPLVAQSVLKALKALWNRDMDSLKEAGVEAMTAVNQAITGLDAEGQKAFGEAIEETTKKILEETDAWIKLESARRSVHRTNRALIQSSEELATAEQLNQAIADDITLSFKERKEAAEEARVALEKRSKIEAQVARNNLSLINQELSLRRANAENVEALLDQQLGAYQALAAAERNYTLAVQDNERTRRELKQDELERDLDILIDGFDNQKTINERIIKDETISFEKRQALLEETRKLGEDSFRKQIETIQEFTGVAIDANELLATSDAVALNEKIRSLGLSEIIEGRQLEIIRDRRLAILDLSDAEKELAAAQKKAREEEAKAQKARAEKAFDVALSGFDQLQEYEASKNALVEMSEAERTKIQLEAQRDRLKKMLELDKKYLSGLNLIQLKTIDNQIKAIEKKIAEVDSGEVKDIYDLFGFDLDDDKKAAINESVTLAVGALDTYLQKRVEASAQVVEQSNTEVDSAQQRLNAEIEAAKAGYASKVDQARNELDLAKKTQQKALEDQRKAQQAQQAIQAVQQASNMITASSKIWAQLGFPFAIPALAVMWGSFLAAQVRAFSATRQFKEGGLEFLDFGGSHASGRDIHLFAGQDGIERRVERGEAVAVINKRNATKYRSLLPEIVDSINRGVFEKIFVQPGTSDNGDVNVFVDTGTMEEHLSALRNRREDRHFVNAQGQTVRIRKHRKTTYVG